MDLRTISDDVRLFMQELCEHLKPVFPQYSAALANELFGKKLTNERWNRIAAILASLAALPGYHFGQAEHDARNPALSAIPIAQKMAAVTFGGNVDVESCLSFASFRVEEIRNDLDAKGKESV